MSVETQTQKGYKLCSKCGQTKTIDDFHKDRSCKDGLSYHCKKCVKENNHRYYVEHQDERRKYSRDYYAEHPEEGRKRAQSRREKNPDKVREQHLSRRIKKKRLPFDFTFDDEIRALDYWHGLCAVCEQPLRDLFGERKPHLDHWIPVSDPRPDNPGTVPQNIVPLCNKCNMSKTDRDPQEWLVEIYGKYKARKISKSIERYFATVSKGC